MVIGIIANITKERAYTIVSMFIDKLSSNGFSFLLSDSLKGKISSSPKKLKQSFFVRNDLLCKKSDIVISIGGDGTMLATAYQAQFYDKPVLGINLGKLGFLAEADIHQIDTLISEIKKGRYTIDERVVVTGICKGHKVEHLFAINDIVIDKGGWPKMIDLTVRVNNEYVTTFAADGLIIATPTGSTGYSLSAGGPIVSPSAKVITLSPISPHSLTVRPLILPDDQTITILTDSLHKEVQVNCDGQRVFAFPPPLEIEIIKSKRPLKLVHTSLTNYYETLRTKLLWGVDVRKNLLDKK
ncbi:MAG: NAD(+)/NADH kinase [Ignavibacteriales bacterium]|nr:MAG: NAD(+)/NADH kinase [Ignavibacteriales bacterium]